MKPLSVSDVAVALGLSVQRVRELIHSGELPAFCPGGSRWRVEPAALQTFIEARRNSSSTSTAPTTPEVKG